jgi:hypothetical protein
LTRPWDLNGRVADPSAAFITDMNALQHSNFCADRLLASDSNPSTGPFTNDFAGLSGLIAGLPTMQEQSVNLAHYSELIPTSI